ncbi:LLM class flavin-dependent oxidoreductase [Comamonas endophytica]|uniref:LLM class flavin-dependent oxidoreductase n=1 Tax=Comamonas endophytica TaxID=2949090 RepID=A0ABY6GAC6_9BURK|nr:MULTISPECIES: LLM class flavin-dependent oxidoreductase [unclassified Acidovorax]MCD2513994.1 LLM class flavin-dependent oxidoreductase [Acidovorax sp. D4N7]UYG52016.1 LLM class flavin-dependent oxidoreductase [Acidovorax sp. 5MLIR]
MRIDIAGWTREAMAGDPKAFAAIFERADRWGFDGVWFSEFRVPQSDWQYPSPLLLAAALLARTERLRVGTAVLVLPLHHPLMLAEEIAQLDFQSGGRIDVGIGRGTEPAALQCLEIDPSSTRERFEQGARILRDALRGDTVASSGLWKFAPRRLMALPVQRPHPPIYIAGSTPETLAFALAQDLPLLLSLEPPEGAQLKRLAEVARQQGGDAQALLARSSLARYVCIGPSAAQVRQQLEGLWERLYARRMHFAGKRGVAPAGVPPIDRQKVLREQFIHGTPEQCHAQIRALQSATGIGSLRCVFNANGLWSNQAALAAMQLFAQEVLPALQRD